MIWRDFCAFQPQVSGPARVSLVIPTINSKAWIDIIAHYYLEQDVDVIFYVDVKCRDGTLDFLRRRFGTRFRVLNLPNWSSTRIAEAVEFVSKDAGSPWILRIDDDELPSIRLLQFCQTAAERLDVDAFSFPRHQCLVSCEGRLLAHIGHDSNAHRQWRLYRADRVSYSGQGHSPGFEKIGLRLAQAPSDACMIHLDWAVHSYTDRKRKVARYDAHTEGHGSVWREYYLFEEKGISGHELKELELPEFKNVGYELRRRFPELCLATSEFRWPPGRNVTVSEEDSTD